MTGRKRLESIARHAPSPVMREFARIAVSRRMTLSALARALNVRARTRHTASSVTRHLLCPCPLAYTIESYAAVLGVRRRHLALLRDEELRGLDLAEALAQSIEALERRSGCFREDTVALATAAVVETLLTDPDAAQRLGRTFALAKIREDSNIADDRAAAHPHFAAIAGPALAAFADALQGRLDVFDRLIDRQPPLRAVGDGPSRTSRARDAEPWAGLRDAAAYG